MIHDSPEGDKILLERITKKRAPPRRFEVIRLHWRDWRLRWPVTTDPQSDVAWEWRVGPLLIRRYKPTLDPG